MGHRRLTLLVSEDNAPARALYAAAGFTAQSYFVHATRQAPTRMRGMRPALSLVTAEPSVVQVRRRTGRMQPELHRGLLTTSPGGAALVARSCSGARRDVIPAGVVAFRAPGTGAACRDFTWPA
jgi:hypothetical protein